MICIFCLRVDKNSILLRAAFVFTFLQTTATAANNGGGAGPIIAGDPMKNPPSNEFDGLRPSLGFNTFPPIGPSTTSTRGSTKVVTSIAVPPEEQARFVTSGTSYRVSRPGMKRGRSRANRDDSYQADTSELNSASSSSDEEKPCQYLFTINKSTDCSSTKTEISVVHGERSTFAVTNGQLDEYARRLSDLENVIYGTRTAASISSTDSSSKDDDVGNSDFTDRLHEIMQQMRIKLLELDSEIIQSRKEKEALQADNDNLVLTLRRGAIARRNLVAIKNDLEKNFRKEKEENARLFLANRTLTSQNRVLKTIKESLESNRDRSRTRIRTMDAEIERSRRENMALSIENSQLSARVGNLSGAFDTCIKISRGESELHLDLENEREKNEILMARNGRLMEDLANITAQITRNRIANPGCAESPTGIAEAAGNRPRLTPSFHSPAADLTTQMPNKSRHLTEEDYLYCGQIISISTPETIRQSRETRAYLGKYGVWMTDPLQVMGVGKVWSINTISERVKELRQYGSMQTFKLDRPENVINLPIPVESTGGAIYNGSIYYQRRNSRKLVRYHIPSKTVLKERAVHRAGFHGMFAYQWGGFTDIDIAVDEYGLWVIYSTRQNKGNIVLARLHPVTLRTWSTVKTSISKRAVANAFMACGILYTVDSYDTENASLNYAFDPRTKRSKRISVPFVNQYRYNVMIDYNPRTRELYSWDNAHQVRYQLQLDRSFGRILDPHGF